MFFNDSVLSYKSDGTTMYVFFASSYSTRITCVSRGMGGLPGSTTAKTVISVRRGLAP